MLARSIFAAAALWGLVAAAADLPERPLPRFKLVNTAAPEVADRVEEHLRRQWVRYRLWLPPRITSPSPLQIELHGTLAGYQAALAARGLKLANPACYMSDPPTVLLGFDGARFDAVLRDGDQRLRKRKAELATLRRTFAAQQKEDAARFQRENTPVDRRQDLQQQRRREFEKAQQSAERARKAAEDANRKLLAEATDRLLTAAAHELFHAYVATELYAAPQAELPAWLNEGLAQVVEDAQWRDDRLLADPPPAELARQLRALFGGAKPLPSLAELLAGQGKGFLVHDPAASAEVRRLYVAAWSVAQFLAASGTFASRDALDRYAADRQTEPVARFERFVGKPLATFETQWQAYVRKVAP